MEESRQKEVSPTFKIIFFGVFILTILFVLLDLSLTFFISEPTSIQRDFISNISNAWKTGFGAILGLIGGKTVH